MKAIICFFLGHKIKATWFTSFDALVLDPYAAPNIEFVFCERCLGQDTGGSRPIFRTLPDVLADARESIADRRQPKEQ